MANAVFICGQKIKKRMQLLWLSTICRLCPLDTVLSTMDVYNGFLLGPVCNAQCSLHQAVYCSNVLCILHCIVQCSLYSQCSVQCTVQHLLYILIHSVQYALPRNSCFLLWKYNLMIKLVVILQQYFNNWSSKRAKKKYNIGIQSLIFFSLC